MAKNGPVVAVIMGSQSDWETMKHAAATLRDLHIPYEAEVISAHRNGDRLAAYCAEAKGRGLKVIIAGAGMAAALPGVIAAATPLPVLGVPIESKLGGLDSLLSMSQMPAGVPVGTLAVGRAGAVNGALLAAAILALADAAVAERLDTYRKEQSERRIELPPIEG